METCWCSVLLGNQSFWGKLTLRRFLNRLFLPETQEIFSQVTIKKSREQWTVIFPFSLKQESCSLVPCDIFPSSPKPLGDPLFYE